MYSSLKNIQILVALLKKYEIKHIVISAGTRHTPFVYSVEHDDYFKTYSIVDERSASFFAIGLIEKLREPVAVVCTSGTAAANYVSAANEAFYQQLPLLLLTADRNHYYMFQQEEQMIPQEPLYQAVCKKVVTLGHVRDEKDFWYASRVCNEALLALKEPQFGPVHINFIVENDYPIHQGIVKFDDEKLPDVKKISKLSLEDDIDIWKHWVKKLQSSKVLIVYGQYGVLTEEETDIINGFVEKFNCVISKDILSNLHTNKTIPTFALSRALNQTELDELKPDIIITMNGNPISEIKNVFMPFKDKFEHWHVSARGEVSDPFKNLSDVVACTPKSFFKRFSELADGSVCDDSYYELWKAEYERIGEKGGLNEVEIPYSSMYATQQYIKNIPEGALLHVANSNSIRLASYFDIHPTVEVYDNRGTHGIDGSMSAFVGQASAKDGLAFLLIGDLSFFYDMNALWNHYIGNNIRIMVCNNSGGAIFHTYPNVKNVPTLDQHIAASHNNSIKAWTQGRGFKYLSATNKQEFETALPQLMSNESSCPIVLEVFTEKEIDAECIKQILAPYKNKDSIKHEVGRIMPKSVKNAIKSIIK